MLPIKTYHKQEIKEIQRACSYLFPPEKIFDLKFLKQINEFILKQSYLKQIRYCHPAASVGDPQSRLDKKLLYLQKARAAFDFLVARLKTETTNNVVRPKGKIIAVGGAKGGIGKSMFSANLSVFLARKGYRTVAMDLDLGGANLTLYLGDKYILDRTINDFLDKKVPSLSAIMIPSRYGPMMIGGDSSDLGAANIHYAKKMKLIKAIRDLEADYIVLDLGGDTSFNMLDFFLLGDYGLVLTTPDSASYIGAYQFLKTALFRKLNRVSGQEAENDRIDDKALADLLQNSTQSSDHPAVRTISELLQKVTDHDPLDLPLALQPIIDFNPYLVVNRAKNATQSQQVTQTITSLAEKTLSIHIESAGSIRKFPEIEDNLRNLAPLVAQNPNGKMARDISNIAANIGLLP
ncbi:MAG: AAA family ATPase [Pseudomonadota bacterium]